MAPKLRELQALSDDEIIDRHDQGVENVVTGVSYWLDEVRRREAASQARTIVNLTWAISPVSPSLTSSSWSSPGWRPKAERPPRKGGLRTTALESVAARRNRVDRHGSRESRHPKITDRCAAGQVHASRRSTTNAPTCREFSSASSATDPPSPVRR